MSETRETLRQLIRKKLGNSEFVVVSNREPYMHVFEGGRMNWIRPASGVTVALDPVMQASRGLWVAHGSGPADAKAADIHGYVAVPPDRPMYRLRRVWLTKEQEQGYYYGFANSALWPLCHVVYRRPIFREDQWEVYQRVNELFAERVAESMADRAGFVFVQDYHLALFPKYLRMLCPKAVIAQFWHIPWPNPEVFRICPWRQQILEGLLANDILGFHLKYHGDNFMGTVDVELETRPDREMTAIVYKGHTTKVRAFPISIDFDSVSRLAASSETSKTITLLQRKYRLGKDHILGLGADRLDYTKGIPERFDAIDVFLKRNPDYHGRFVFIQAAVPSRTQVEEYRRLAEEVFQRAEAINWKYGHGDWQPIVLVREHLKLPTLVALYRMAHFVMVSSLHDGMNLVAKEFVAARNDNQGVLILSKFTGAARELQDALIINPYTADLTADVIRKAITMESAEARRRMIRLREQVREHNVFGWAASVLKKMSKLA